MAKCQTPIPEECPWTPDEWRKFGRMEEKIDLLLDRVDNLNHVRKRGATAGAAGGGLVTFVIVGLYSWAKTKWAWIPLIIIVLLLTSCTVGFYGSCLQSKSLTFGDVKYSTNSDAAADAAKAAVEGAMIGAKGAK